MIEYEDIAHIVVQAPREQVGLWLDQELKERGYAKTALKGDAHLVSRVNWDSPFDPPPRNRCFMLIPDQDGWTTVVEQIDRLDDELALSLSHRAVTIEVKGASQIETFEYRALHFAADLSQVDESTESALSAIRSNPDHVTRFCYNDIILTLDDQMELEFRGYTLAG